MSSIELGPQLTQQKPRYVGISATITRADGTVEELGVVAEQYFGFWPRFYNLINRIKQGLPQWK